jgi:hypothetical protein
VVGCCDLGNEPSGSIESDRFHEWWSVCGLLRTELLELVQKDSAVRRWLSQEMQTWEKRKQVFPGQFWTTTDFIYSSTVKACPKNARATGTNESESKRNVAASVTYMWRQQRTNIRWNRYNIHQFVLCKLKPIQSLFVFPFPTTNIKLKKYGTSILLASYMCMKLGLSYSGDIIGLWCFRTGYWKKIFWHRKEEMARTLWNSRVLVCSFIYFTLYQN